MVAKGVRTNETASQSPTEKMTRTSCFCYLPHTESCTHFYISQYISFLYITFYISQGSHHKLEGALSKSGHWFMFVYQHLTCVEILGCPALTEIRNSLKQDLSLKLLVKCVDEMTVHRGCLLAR